MGKVTHVDDQSFEIEVAGAGIPVLVDFWAPWCGPCRMLEPVVEQLAEEYEGRVKVAKVNTDESPGVATTMGIRSIPTVVLFDGKDVQDVLIGARPKAAFAELLDKYLKKREKKLAKEEKQRRKSEWSKTEPGSKKP